MNACKCELEIDKNGPLEFVKSWSDSKGVYAQFKPVYVHPPTCSQAKGCQQGVKYKWVLIPDIAGTAAINGKDDEEVITVKHELISSQANIKISLTVTVTVECDTVYMTPGQPTVVIKRHKSDSGTDDSILF